MSNLPLFSANISPIKMIPSTAAPWNNRDGVAVIDHCYRINFPHFEREISCFTVLCVHTPPLFVHQQEEVVAREGAVH